MTTPDVVHQKEVEAEAGPAEEPALQVTGLVKRFVTERGLLGWGRREVHAVDGVDLHVAPGETLGIVGESGSGKSTVARLIARLLKVDDGCVVVHGRDVTDLSRRGLKDLRSTVQFIFQDPYSALDPTKTVGHAVTEPLLVHGRMKRRDARTTARALLERVGMNAEMAERRPSQLSGGQRQRVCIARALALSPRILIADEPTSALDLSTQSEILNLLLQLQREEGLAIIFISHDFSAVMHLAHRTAVMYLGRIVEEGDTETIAAAPQHPYTRALLSAVPVPDPEVQRDRTRIVLEGALPDPSNPPTGCNFRTRCPEVVPRCAEVDPALVGQADGRAVACIHHLGSA